MDASAAPTFNVLGVRVSALNLRTATEQVMGALREGRKGYISVTGVHGVSEAQHDAAFRRILNQSFLVTPDGMPLAWLGKLHAGREVDRVYGPDLMLAVCEATQNTPYRHFFYGGAPGVAEQLARNLAHRFPGLQVAGHFSPPFGPLSPEQERALIDRVAQERPAIMWIGLSTPKQERFMHAYLPKLETTLMFGVGAAFDFHTGRVRQAPRMLQRAGLEWAFRLGMEPRRLWRRYLKNNPRFVARIALQLSGLKRYPTD